MAMAMAMAISISLLVLTVVFAWSRAGFENATRSVAAPRTETRTVMQQNTEVLTVKGAGMQQSNGRYVLCPLELGRQFVRSFYIFVFESALVWIVVLMVSCTSSVLRQGVRWYDGVRPSPLPNARVRSAVTQTQNHQNISNRPPPCGTTK